MLLAFPLKFSQSNQPTQERNLEKSKKKTILQTSILRYTLRRRGFQVFNCFWLVVFLVFCAVRNTRKNRENRKQQYSVAKYDQNMEHKKIQTLKITAENPLWRFVCLLLFRSCTMRSSRFCACLSGMYEKNSEPESNESNSRTRRTQA